MASVRAGFKAFVFVAFIVLYTLPVVLLTLVNLPKIKMPLIASFYKGILFFFNIKLSVDGQMPKDSGGYMLASNHLSYIDIFLIGSVFRVIFTPKSDVASWLVIGFLCKMADCIFIERKRTKTAENKEKIKQAFSEGKNICIFSEGTTSNGLEVLPFKSSYFEVARPDENLQIQILPICVFYERINVAPANTAEQMDNIAWYGDMDFFSHFWQMLKLKRVDAVIKIGAPVAAVDDRKETAKLAESAVHGMFEELSRL